MVKSLKMSAGLLLLVSAICWTAQPALAEPFTAPDDLVPNPAKPLVATETTIYPGVPGGPIEIEIVSMQLSGSGIQSPQPAGPGNWTVDSFFDIFVEIDPISPPGTTQSGSGNGHVQGTGTGTTDRIIDTEMIAMQLTGGGITIRESPTLPSTGQTRIIDLPGGNYHIDSFFDVFTEITLDGGATWYPSQGSTHLTSLPEPGSVLLLTVGAAALGITALRRRRVR
jgi:hypothetical protein